MTFHLTLHQILFLAIGAIALGAAVMVVTRRDVLQAVFYLILSLVGVTGLYMLLEAPVLAAVHLFVWAGDIATLIVLAAVLTRGPMRSGSRGASRQWWAAALVAAALCAVLIWTTRTLVVRPMSHDWQAFPAPVPEHSVAALGTALVDPDGFALPLAVTAALLLAGLFGAAAVLREH
jgi:NADH-quinone oxidoreductase subunit J